MKCGPGEADTVGEVKERRFAHVWGAVWAVLQPETVYLSVEQRGLSRWACPKSMDYDAKGV